MSVKELMELLDGVPEDAEIMVRHELIGDEHSAARIEYDKNKNIVWIHEIFE